MYTCVQTYIHNYIRTYVRMDVWMYAYTHKPTNTEINSLELRSKYDYLLLRLYLRYFRFSLGIYSGRFF